MGSFLESLWYGRHPLSFLLMPLSGLFRAGVGVRRLLYRSGVLGIRRVEVPVVVVGNITVGGTGKTPLVIWLADFLTRRGFRCAVMCRGYGGRAAHWPQQVRPDSDPVMAGDEAVLLARRCACPVAAGPDRVRVARELVRHSQCNLLICDDGLQHLALGRSVEIAVIDGTRRFGNGRCLPAGPLREPVSRLARVDLVVTNGAAQRGEFAMRLIAQVPRNVANPKLLRPVAGFQGAPVHAVCGIGNPERFFTQLRALGLTVIPHAFPDHHPFAARDICFDDGQSVLMTEKDAVKCRDFAGPGHWYLPVEAEPHPHFGHRLLNLLQRRSDGQEAH